MSSLLLAAAVVVVVVVVSLAGCGVSGQACPPPAWPSNATGGLPCPNPPLADMEAALEGRGWIGRNVNVSAYPSDFRGYAYVDDGAVPARLQVVTGGIDVWDFRDSGIFLMRGVNEEQQPAFEFEGTLVNGAVYPELSPWVKAGLILRRDQLDPASPFVDLWWGKGDGGAGRVAMHYRVAGARVAPSSSSPAWVMVDGVLPPVGLRLRRDGDVFTGWYRHGGNQTWTLLNSFNLPGLFPSRSTFWYGLFGTAHSAPLRPFTFAFDYDSVHPNPACSPACDATLAECFRERDIFPGITGTSQCRCLTTNATADPSDPTGAACPPPPTPPPPPPSEEEASTPPPTSLLENPNVIIGTSVAGAILLFGGILILANRGAPRWVERTWNKRPC